MDLTNKFEIKRLLKNYNKKPEKCLGQHFILSKKALFSIVAAAEIKKDETIFEIGPGLGTLTKELANTGANIIAIEKDPLMINILKETTAKYKNIKIIRSDARNISLPITNLPDVGHRVKGGKGVDKHVEHKKCEYKIVANLPYNAATFLIRKWLESKMLPQTMVLMVQKEVAQRITAKTPHSNLLGISVQFYADAKIIGYVKKELFSPKPKVDAAIIKIVPKKPPVISREAFFDIVKAGFSQPRKQLLGNICKKLGIPKEKLISIFKNSGISEKARAENLSSGEWQNLASNLIHK